MILEDIVESTKERVETNKKRHSIYELKEKAFAMPIDQSFPFKKALEKDGMSYILEVKRHSPSRIWNDWSRCYFSSNWTWLF